jgi:hypothetical protein
MYGWISWIVLAQSEFRARNISSLHVFATVNELALPRFKIRKSFDSNIQQIKRRKGVIGFQRSQGKTDAGCQIGRGKAAGVKLNPKGTRVANDPAQF